MCNMTRFATALITWMDSEAHIKSRALSRLTGISAPDISYIRNGERGISVEKLTTLMDGIKAHYGLEPALRLLIAHLRDETPVSYQDDISVEMAGNVNTDDTKTPPVKVALDYFASRAAIDAEFSAWLVQFAKLCGVDFESRIEMVTVASVSRDSELTYPSRLNSASPEPLESDSLSETDTERILLAAMQAAEAAAAAKPRPDRSTPETTP